MYSEGYHYATRDRLPNCAFRGDITGKSFHRSAFATRIALYIQGMCFLGVDGFGTEQRPIRCRKGYMCGDASSSQSQMESSRYHKPSGPRSSTSGLSADSIYSQVPIWRPLNLWRRNLHNIPSKLRSISWQIMTFVFLLKYFYLVSTKYV